MASRSGNKSKKRKVVKKPRRRIEGEGSGVLTLENTDPIQMGLWAPNRVWATAKFLIPLREHIERKKKAGVLPPLTAVMADFKSWVTSNSVYRN